MAPAPLIVRLRVLDTDVDVHVGGVDPERLAAGVRERWHLCLRDPDAGPAPDGIPPVTLTVALEAEPQPGPDTDPAAPRPTPTSPAPAPAPTFPATAPVPGRREATDLVGSDEAGLFTRLTHAVTGAVIRSQSGRLLMLHAAALADPVTGATLVAVAAGGTGKSTLCRVHGPGRVYLTDETVGIRRDGSLAAYPKPVSLRRSEQPFGKDEVPPSALGLDSPPVQTRVAGVVLLRRDPEHEGPAVVEGLDTLEALAALAPESSAFMVTERPLTWLAGLLESTGGARRVTYSDTAHLADLVAEVLGRTPATDPTFTAQAGPAAGDQPTALESAPHLDPDTPPGPDTSVRSVPVRDEVVRDGASVVLHEGQVLHLSAIATAVRALAADWVTVAELVARVEDVVGPAPDGEGLTLLTTQLEELARLGLVEVSGRPSD